MTTVRCRSRRSAVWVATTASSRSLSARARIARTLANSSCTAVKRLLDLSLLGTGALRHFVVCKTLMAELCLEVMDGVSRVGQQPLGLLARSGLQPQRLPCGIQLFEARAAVTMNDCHEHVAIAHKMTPLMRPIGRVMRMSRLRYGSRIPI